MDRRCGLWPLRTPALPRPALMMNLAPLVVMTLLAGCAHSPRYVRPEMEDVTPDAYFAAGAQDETGRIDYAWWEAFGDTLLNGVVIEALAANHDLAQAAARVLESRALLTGRKSERWPAIQVGGNATRSKFTLAQFGGRGSVYNTLYSATASASYELDLWGRLSRAEEAAFATLLASEEDQRTVRQTLVADVVRGWLEIRALECQLVLNRRTIRNYESNLQLVEERYRRGLVPPVDVHLARQNLLSARAMQPQWEQDLATARRRLELLAGRYPAAGVDRPDGRAEPDRDTCECRMPPELPAVPAGLPSELLERRPDVLAAELRLRAATAGIGSAKASLFPRIALTGDAGYRTREIAELFKTASSIWSLVGSVTAPILNWGAQKSQIQIAEARTAQALAAYQATVLNAFREVEAALDAEGAQQQRRNWLQGAVEQARHSLSLAEDRYRRGLDNLLLTLDTQRRLYNAESELIRTEQAYRTARVNLILALGGPWSDGDHPEVSSFGDQAPPATARPADHATTAGRIATLAANEREGAQP